jgi:signal transduction histidine kinase/PAS domain-containing protein
VLELIIRGAPLGEVLAALCRIAEAEAGRPVRAAILLVDAGGRHLRSGAAPSLPDSYTRAVDGVPVSAQIGTCARAAALNEIVVTPCIDTDPGWALLKHLPMGLGLHAAWSMPIVSASGAVLGTFGTYFPEVREPTDGERELVAVLARTAALAIERGRADAALRAASESHRLLAELATAMQALSDPVAVMDAATRLLGEHLGVDRVIYGEVDGEDFNVLGGWSPGLPNLTGRRPLTLLTTATARAAEVGATLVVADAATDERLDAGDLDAYRRASVSAVVFAPLRKAGVFTAALVAQQSLPRNWTDEECHLVEQVSARCWETIERVRVARDLRDSEARHRAAVEAGRARLDYAMRLSGLGFFYCDLPFATLEWDAQVRAQFFVGPREPVTIDTFYDRIHPDDREPTRLAIEASITGGAPYDVVYRTCDPHSDRVNWIRALGGIALAADGSAARFDGVTLDVTRQKRDEQRLAQLLAGERDHAVVLAGIAEAASALHACGSVRAVLHTLADAARTLLRARVGTAMFAGGEDVVAQGAATDDVDAEALAESGAALHAQLGPGHRSQRRAAAELAAHAPWPGAAPPDGWLAVPLVAHDHAPLGLVQVFDRAGGFSLTDEAVLAQLARFAAVALENARLVERLREQDQRKDEFIATLAHELRNPLAPIRTGLNILRMTSDPEAARRSREVMERQLAHLVRLVDDLLDVSRITRGKVGLVREVIDVDIVIDTALEASRPVIEAHGHTLSVDMPAQPVLVDADPTRLAQVVANLLNNAAKYTPRGGRIALAVGATGNRLEVRVSDNGIGIEAQALPRIFDLFVQAGMGPDRAPSGLGIGLTLVRRLLELHDGCIEAHSEGPGKGSTFVAWMPLRRVAQA